MPNDTTTTLNLATVGGGDKMDESLITQSDQITQAKRARVVIAGDASGAAIVDPVTVDPGRNPCSVPVLIVGVVDDTQVANYAPGELRPASISTGGRLSVLAELATTDFDFFGVDGDEPPSIWTSPPNPWS